MSKGFGRVSHIYDNNARGTIIDEVPVRYGWQPKKGTYIMPVVQWDGEKKAIPCSYDELVEVNE